MFNSHTWLSGYRFGWSSIGPSPLEGCCTSREFMDPVKFILALYALWLKIVLFTSYNPIHSFKKKSTNYFPYIHCTSFKFVYE